MKDYWGGMLKLGATSFWEEYKPALHGEEHYAMYGRPFGKSLCHAWGASPIYLLGKYYLGVKPTSPGYATYDVQPVLGGLQWIHGHVPTPKGNIAVKCSTKEMDITTAEGVGTLRFKSVVKPVCTNGIINSKGDWYEMSMEPNKNYIVKYVAKK
jgi:hypothetical protein